MVVERRSSALQIADKSTPQEQTLEPYNSVDVSLFGLQTVADVGSEESLLLVIAET